MSSFKNPIFAMFIIFFTSAMCVAAPKLGFIDNILRHSDDVVKLGKKAEKLTPNVRADIIKRYPRLANASEDLISGVHTVEEVASRSASAGKMIENGVNSAKVATLAARSPETIETGDKIARIFASSKVSQQTISMMPTPAASALRKADGNYREAGEMFLQMERRGGSRAVDVAEKLSKYATMGNAAAATALGLLAWHMADPAGAEQAVEGFFRDHVAPVVVAPAKGVLNAAGDAAQDTLETATNKVTEIATRFWPALLILMLLVLLWRVPNLRRMPFIFLDNFFGRLNKKMESSSAQLGTFVCKASSDQLNNSHEHAKINVFKK